MSDLDHLDPRIGAAFEALTRDLEHHHGPGAAAAMSTARARRRTRVGAVALATLIVVGGGLTVPRLLGPAEDGVASDGGSARLDEAALDRATEGWIGAWEAWELSEEDRAQGGAASCFVSRIPAGAEPDPTAWNEPDPVAGGESSFSGSRDSHVSVTMSLYDDATQAASAQEQVYPPADSCSDTTFIDVDGVQVRHGVVADLDPGVWETDVWSVQMGDERGEVMLHTGADPADDAIAERVAEALVAGLRDGWTQSGTEPIAPVPDDVAQLPPLDGGRLGRALGGWHAASRGSASTVPNTPCLGESVGAGAVTTSSGGRPDGVTWDLAGFEDDAAGVERVGAMLAELRACADPAMDVEELPNGVTVVTYDYGTADGRGALWLAENGDRAGVIGVDGADRPMPMGVDEDVAQVLYTWLRLPWD